MTTTTMTIACLHGVAGFSAAGTGAMLGAALATTAVAGATVFTGGAFFAVLPMLLCF